MTNRMAGLKALLKKYEAEMEMAFENVCIYVTNPVGIGEHSGIVESLDVEVRKYMDAKEMVNTIVNLIDTLESV